MPESPSTTTRPSGVRPPPAHPLCGADLATLCRVVGRCGWASRRRTPALALAFAAALGRLPSTALEHGYTSRVLAQRGDLPPTLFILGHWRSGTTHLYNVMAKAPRFAFLPPVPTGLPWDALGLARVLRRPLEAMLPRERWIDPVPVEPDSPQEDEIALANMDPLSFYHGIYFPRQLQTMLDRGVFLDGVSERELARWWRRFDHLHRKAMALRPTADTLLIKNPTYTARVADLHARLPSARFVHLHRHPYEVFRSMRNFWHKLLAALSLQDFSHVDVDELVLSTYARMMRAYFEQSAALPEGVLIEMGYHELKDDAVASIERIYQTLGLKGFDADAERFRNYLRELGRYANQRYEMDEASKRRIDERWGPIMERLGYEPRP